MKGSIIVPTFYYKRHLDGIKSQRAKFLFNELRREYKLSIVYTDNPSLRDLDVAIIYAVPYHNRPRIPPGLLRSKTKLIGYYEDLQCWDNEECKRNKKKAFDRYDILMGACYEVFMDMYSRYLHKHVHFPNFFVLHGAYANLQPNKHPKMQCLMAGTVNKYYPLRLHIRRSRNKLVAIKKAPFIEYPLLLNSYFCALAIPGTLRNVAAKYLEIPAAGTLMLAERVKELDIMGLKPHVHYVPVTKEDVFDRIEECLTNPKEFVAIRDEGTEFVRRNHSVKNRVALFGEILERIL